MSGEALNGGPERPLPEATESEAWVGTRPRERSVVQCAKLGSRLIRYFYLGLDSSHLIGLSACSTGGILCLLLET